MSRHFYGARSRFAVAGFATFAALTLTACPNSTLQDTRPIPELASPLALPPAEIVEPCRPPKKLPPGDMNADNVLLYWSEDRMSLAECLEKHKDQFSFDHDRDAGLAGK